MMTLNITQFWSEVATAYERTSIDASLEIVIERENKRALVRSIDGVTLITVSEIANEKPPALVVPPGQGRR